MGYDSTLNLSANPFSTVASTLAIGISASCDNLFHSGYNYLQCPHHGA